MDYFNEFRTSERTNGKSDWTLYSATDLYNSAKPFYKGIGELTPTLFGRQMRKLPDNIVQKKKSKTNNLYFIFI